MMYRFAFLPEIEVERLELDENSCSHYSGMAVKCQTNTFQKSARLLPPFWPWFAIPAEKS